MFHLAEGDLGVHLIVRMQRMFQEVLLPSLRTILKTVIFPILQLIIQVFRLEICLPPMSRVVVLLVLQIVLVIFGVI